LTPREQNKNIGLQGQHPETSMQQNPQPDPQAESDRLDSAADEAIAACDGDMRSAIRALILANEYLEWELEQNVSRGFLRGVKHGRFKTYSG
jgi:hypothetical protein